MNLQPLFDTQDKLDQRIKEQKSLQGVDLLDKKILALQVELGELANEWRGFKFWSEHQEPRTKEKIECSSCDGTGDVNAEANMVSLMEGKDGEPYEACEDCNATGISGYKNPLLEEYVDCLHFILSIGNDLGISEPREYRGAKPFEVTLGLINLMAGIGDLYHAVGNRFNKDVVRDVYEVHLYSFIHIGTLLGFTWNQIEQAYYDKNKINHERQANGY